MKTDLAKYGIECEGELRKSANIESLVADLVDDNLKRRFIAGLADTIGSTKQSHRRFSDVKQMISFEISGFSYKFVCSLCKLLHSIKCYPDQILWNHPNFHSASNPYYKRWKKNFKLRVYLDQYDKFGAFAFTSKAESAVQNRQLESKENVAIPCEKRLVSNPSVSCVHCDEGSPLLPENIRDGHYLHNRHVCAVMGCEYAPYDQVKSLIDEAEKYINPFPVLVKGTVTEIEDVIREIPLYGGRNYIEHNLPISWVYEQYKNDSNNSNDMLFQTGNNAGYPINQIMRAITYLIAATLGRLKGQRPKGAMSDILRTYLYSSPCATVKVLKPDLLTPIVLSIGSYSALVGPYNPSVYKKLIHKSPNNKYKIIADQITEEHLV
ncbi:MAG: hypothetical protein PHV50_06375 [Syntrophaceticus sp.]|nr:hypothetical protein [Syntrophaceticus sp.]MDD4360171.1 hypothetical protein [Syntrophaceticus sp.]